MPRFFALLIAFGIFIAVQGCGKKPKVAPPVAVVTINEGTADDGPTLAELIAQLKHKNPDQRMKAVAALANLKDIALEQALLDALSDPGCSVLGDYYPKRAHSTREGAVLVLLKLGPAAKQALITTGLTTLRSGLEVGDPTVKEHTLYAISYLGADAAPAANDILKLCTAKEVEVRRAAYTALKEIGKFDAMPIVKLLLHTDPDIRRDAAEAFLWFKPVPPVALPVLIDVLKDKANAKKEPRDSTFIRSTAAEMIASLGPAGKDAIPVLVDCLRKAGIRDKDAIIDPTMPTYRPDLDAMDALEKIGKPAIPVLIGLLGDPSVAVRWQAAATLGNMRKAASEALPALQTAMDKELEQPDRSHDVITESAMAMVNIGGDPAKPIAKMVELLENEQATVRYLALRVLRRSGRKAEPAVKALIPLLDDPDETIRLEAARSLRAIGPAAKAAVPALAAKLEDEDDKVRREAVRTLRGFGPDAVAAMPALIKGLADSQIRDAVLDTLQMMGPYADEAVPALIKLLKMVTGQERLKIIGVIGAIGPKAKEAVPELLALFAGRDEELTTAILQTLGGIGPVDPKVVPAVAAKLKDNLMRIRIAAVKTLARMGPAAKGASTELQVFGKDKASSAGIWAAVALAQMGIDREANIALLLQGIRNNEPSGKTIRIAAMQAVEYLGPAGSEAIPALMDRLKEKELPGTKTEGNPMRLLAVAALGKMGPAAKPAVPILTEMLKERDDELKQAVIAALGELGPTAEFATARLRDVARNDKNLAGPALEAVEKIEGKK